MSIIMTDIYLRLRELQGGAYEIMPSTVKEAADEIKELRKECQRLREWKESAMQILRQWHEVAESVGGVLGSSQVDNVRAEIAMLREALDKLWKHTPKIDNGRCMVCRVGYAGWEPDGKGDLKVG